MTGVAEMGSVFTDRPRLNGALDEEAVGELVTSLKRRLPEVEHAEVPALVAGALTEFGPVRVTKYLSILVERSIRDHLSPAADTVGR